MVASLITLTLTGMAQHAAAQSLAVPSGAPVEVLEYLLDDIGEGPLLRARYHAPTLTGQDDIDAVLQDMTFLCEVDAVPVRNTLDPQPDRIIVSLSSAPIDFGASDADVTQYFEAYILEEGRCIWELF